MLNELSCWYFDWATVGTWVALNNKYSADQRMSAEDGNALDTLLNEITAIDGDIERINRMSTLESFGKCRAWVNINGTGAVTTRGAHNVSSVTWVSTGVYRVNFATPMPNTGYAVVVGGEPAGGSGNKYYGYAVTPAYATVSVYNAAGALADGSIINVAVFG